jgi:hypothetical protein
LEFIETAAKSQPVLVFNFAWHIDCDFGLGEAGLVKQCTTDDHVFEVQEMAE